jgi:hypothetical protein
MKVSPLLHGVETKNSLDLITKRLYFIWPLSPNQVEWLNTIIYKDDLFWINYWSLTHLVFGVIWELIRKCTGYNTLFGLTSYLVVHTIFEIWELWAGGYLSGVFPLDKQEIMDCVMDTIFGLAGIFITVKIFETR